MGSEVIDIINNKIKPSFNFHQSTNLDTYKVYFQAGFC